MKTAAQSAAWRHPERYYLTRNVNPTLEMGHTLHSSLLSPGCSSHRMCQTNLVCQMETVGIPFQRDAAQDSACIEWADRSTTLHKGLPWFETTCKQAITQTQQENTQCAPATCLLCQCTMHTSTACTNRPIHKCRCKVQAQCWRAMPVRTKMNLEQSLNVGPVTDTQSLCHSVKG